MTFIILYLTIQAANLHDFHLSKCDIYYKAEQETFQITIHIFIDDLEKALSAITDVNLKICTLKEDAGAETMIYQYLNDHFKISVDGQQLDLSWVGKEASDDLAGIWCYLEAKITPPQSHIDISNDLLTEVYADQRNIVKLVVDHNRKGYFLLDQKGTSGTLKL